MKPPFLLAAALFTTTAAAADEKHAIDQKIAKLFDAANSTADSTRAYTTGLELWDKESVMRTG